MTDGGGGLGDSDPLALPDLASRALRGSVIAASDEFFAEKENLILPGAAGVHGRRRSGTRGRCTTAGRRAGGAARPVRCRETTSTTG